MPPWLPITDAQKAIIQNQEGHSYGRRLLLLCPTGWHSVIIGRWWQCDDSNNWLADAGDAVRPTHYMELPPDEIPA